VLVDACYEKIRRNHKVESNGMLIAKGANAQGKRDLLGIQVCNTENQTTWDSPLTATSRLGLLSASC
jgi:transposase-like protein